MGYTSQGIPEVDGNRQGRRTAWPGRLDIFVGIDMLTLNVYQGFNNGYGRSLEEREGDTNAVLIPLHCTHQGMDSGQMLPISLGDVDSP